MGFPWSALPPLTLGAACAGHRARPNIAVTAARAAGAIARVQELVQGRPCICA